MNGDVEGEKRDRVVDLSIDRESDGGDDLSQYSSCGGESEMERYYSAGSAIGTPRVFQSSAFGSGRSVNFGGETDVFGAEKASGGEMLNSRGKFEVSDDVARDLDSDGGKLCNGVSIGDGKLVVLDDGDRKIYGGEDGEFSVSSEHSEGEDSMFGCGSDDEGKKIQYYYRKSEEERGKTDDHLVMSSAAAFGSDDWDDFVHENMQTSVSPMVWDETEVRNPTNQHNGVGSFDAYSFEGKRSNLENTLVDSNQAKVDGELAEKAVGITATSDESKPVHFPGLALSGTDALEEHVECSAYSSEFEMNRGSSTGATGVEKFEYDAAESEVKEQETVAGDIMTICSDIASETSNLKQAGALFQPVRDNQNFSRVSAKGLGGNVSSEDDASHVVPLLASTHKSSMTNENAVAAPLNQKEDQFMPITTKDIELNDFYDEIVNDMQDVLLDSGESPQSGATHGSRIYQSQMFRPSRDGGSTSSTSGTKYAYDWIQQVPKIDRVEVIGATQKQGDVSFSERLVGVQKHAVYRIRVSSGEDHWEIERRYRDFSALYHRVKKSFTENGWTLPSPWSAVERESFKIFGSASLNVIADRSILIQDCLQSIIRSNISLNCLTSFLAPSDFSVPESSLLWSSFHNRGKPVENRPSFGKTISLIVHIQPSKTIKEMLDLQYYRCAGCHRNFEDGTSTVRGFVMALGWGKPRYCEYIGQLFCSSCHVNDTAVIPSKVLHCWDFTLYPVSQFSKSFLDSIYDQPMLCVGAINPFLFSRVPTLQHVSNIRNRIRAVLPYIRCPFRRSIYKSLGSRSYLLDSNDFFALKDLIDLSKGVFSVLAVMVEALSQKIQDHITEQCLMCYDAGVPCSARQACTNPLALIFPFQEGDVEKCRSCEVIFHKKCFQNLASCSSCGANVKPMNRSLEASSGGNGSVSGFLSKVLPIGSSQQLLLGNQKMKKPENGGNKNNNAAAILMASLPNATSL